MTWLLLSVGTALLLTVGSVSAGPYEDAATAYGPGDYVAALKTFQSLAVQGNAKAQNNLGVMYDNGQGVTQDYVRAYMWLKLAAENSKSDQQKSAADARDEVARRMTSAQLAKAQRLAQQCQSQQFKGC
ncbi:MAG: hypothetical protein ABL983_10145 [Nitrospira sp.]